MNKCAVYYLSGLFRVISWLACLLSVSLSLLLFSFCSPNTSFLSITHSVLKIGKLEVKQSRFAFGPKIKLIFFSFSKFEKPSGKSFNLSYFLLFALFLFRFLCDIHPCLFCSLTPVLRKVRNNRLKKKRRIFNTSLHYVADDHIPTKGRAGEGPAGGGRLHAADPPAQRQPE